MRTGEGGVACRQAEFFFFSLEWRRGVEIEELAAGINLGE